MVNDLSEFAPRLAACLGDATDLELSRHAEFLDLLRRWNRRIGLTAITDPGDMVVRHVLDSLAAIPFLSGKRIIDVGTGPGLPGIPLAVALPDCHFCLLDSLEKRMVFVRQAVFTLKLQNVEVVTSRVQTYRPEAGFDTLVTRAFASLADILKSTDGLRVKRVVALKGPGIDEEIAALDARLQAVTECQEVAVPGLQARRFVAVVRLDRLDTPRIGSLTGV